MPGPGRPRKTETEKLEEEFDNFDKQVKELTQDAMNKAPKREEEPQTQLSQKELKKDNGIYLKPQKTIPPGRDERFNESYRKEWESQKEYIEVIAENKEVIGESITIWTKKFPGTNCEMYEVPVNKPVWMPKYLANQIASCTYHILKTVDKPITQSNEGTFYGSLVVTETVNRLDANIVPKSTRISVGKFQ